MIYEDEISQPGLPREDKMFRKPKDNLGGSYTCKEYEYAREKSGRFAAEKETAEFSDGEPPHERNFPDTGKYGKRGSVIPRGSGPLRLCSSSPSHLRSSETHGPARSGAQYPKCDKSKGSSRHERDETDRRAYFDSEQTSYNEYMDDSARRYKPYDRSYRVGHNFERHYRSRRPSGWRYRKRISSNERNNHHSMSVRRRYKYVQIRPVRRDRGYDSRATSETEMSFSSAGQSDYPMGSREANWNARGDVGRNEKSRDCGNLLRGGTRRASREKPTGRYYGRDSFEARRSKCHHSRRHHHHLARSPEHRHHGDFRTHREYHSSSYSTSSHSERKGAGRAVDHKPRYADPSVEERLKHKSTPRPSPGKKNDDSEIVHFKWKTGMALSRRYIVKSQLGEGTFGRVLECFDLRDRRAVAVKVIRDISRYTSASKIEAEILEEIKAKDPKNQSNCVVLVDQFYYDVRKNKASSSPPVKKSKKYSYRSEANDTSGSDSKEFPKGVHMCLVFETLGLSLFAFLSRNAFKGFFLSDIQKISYETLKALAFLYEIRLTHTDLKPENILLVNSSSELVPLPRSNQAKRFWNGDTDSNSSDRGSSSHHRRKKSRTCRKGLVKTYRPLDCRVKLIDFGSATFEDDEHCTLINTRQYRAPEVILQIGWSMASDIWGLGCILMELYTGMLLFKTHEHLEHLEMMERIIEPFPPQVLEQASRTDGERFLYPRTADGKFRLNWPEGASSARSIERVARCKKLEDLVLPEHESFASFVRYLLTIDPRKRPTPKEAMQHPFLHENIQD